MTSLALSLYSAVMVLLQPLLRRKLLRRAQQEPLYGQHLGERFGHYTSLPDAGAIWIHAVSLGETRTAALLLAALRACLPGMKLLLTHGTATGREAGRELLGPGDQQVWLPWDTPQATRAFLAHHRPAIGILLETEIWPNLIAQAHSLGVPMVLANARMSDKSLRQALRLKALAQPAFAGLHAVWAQTEDDARRLRLLKAPVQAVLGNIKFDATPNEKQLALGQRWRAASPKPVVLLASSREGEETMWIDAIQRQPDAAQWLVVPRHPQRFEEVAALLGAAGLSYTRRSLWQDSPIDAQVWLGDSMGEMALYYAMSDAALLGGSFAPLGGQNLIEAAACGCPVFMGPHTFNFAQASELAIEAGAATRCADMQAALDAAVALEGQGLVDMQRAALQFAGAHRGAAMRTAQAVAEVLRFTLPAGR